MKNQKIEIGIIGAGNMGSAIIGGICGQYSVSVCEQDAKRRQALKRKYKISTGSLQEVVEKSQVIILAVKPQNFDDVLAGISSLVTKDKLVVSIAAGITCRYIERGLGVKMRVIRTMPNLPVLVGEGIIAICPGNAAKKKDLTLVQQIFSRIGATIVVQEKQMDAITAASGSGPAYVFHFIECFKKGVRSLGLDEELSRALVLQTIKGSLGLLESQDEDAAVLRARVTSKGGTTQAAMDVFKKHDFQKVFKAALSAAKKRSKELAK